MFQSICAFSYERDSNQILDWISQTRVCGLVNIEYGTVWSCREIQYREVTVAASVILYSEPRKQDYNMLKTYSSFHCVFKMLLTSLFW